MADETEQGERADPAAGVPERDEAARLPAPESPAGVDLGRRRFFRQFASDLIQSAATVAGAASALQRTSVEAASALLDPVTTVERLGIDRATGQAPRPAVFRTAFRVGDESLLLLDQRKLPEAVVEYECITAADAAQAIRERVVRGAPAIGQVAALALALAAQRMRDARAYARRATLRGSANALANARPSSITIRRAVDRMMAAYEAVGDLSEDGAAVAAAMRREADAIVFEATDAHGRLAVHGVSELPVPVDHPLRVLTLGNSGVLAGGQFGTALGVVFAAVAAGRDVDVLVAETRPLLQGARLTAWELGNAGIPYTLIADGAAATKLARGEVDVVLVAADRVAANGDFAAVLGTYQLAVLAARHGVPFVVCAPCATFDPGSAGGEDLPLDERGSAELVWIGTTRLAPPDARATNPVADVTPAELVSAIITEVGVLRQPFGPALAAAGTSPRAATPPGPPAPVAADGAIAEEPGPIPPTVSGDEIP